MKLKGIDIAVSVIFVLALVVIYFFWGCKLDLYVTIFAAVVFVITGIIKVMQYRKIKELEQQKQA